MFIPLCVREKKKDAGVFFKILNQLYVGVLYWGSIHTTDHSE